MSFEFLNGKKVVVVFGIFLVLFLVLASILFLKMKSRSSPLKVSVISEEIPVVVPGEPKVEEKKGSQQKVGEIEAFNSAGVAFELQVDTSTPLKRAVYSLINRILKEKGYAMTLFNRKEIGSDFPPLKTNPGANPNNKDCLTFSFLDDREGKQLKVYFFIEKPASGCQFLMPSAKPLWLAITAFEGNGDWWKNGVEAISQELGRPPAIEDFPLAAVEVK